MCSSTINSIPLESLDKLSKVFTKNWPKHIIIHSTLQLFIKQLLKFPELEQRLKVYSLSDDWENNGSFFATDVETFVFFDSLNGLEKNEILRTTLDYTKLITYFSIRNEFRSLALSVIKDLNLQCIEDTDGICFFLPKEEAWNLEISLPPNTHLRSLTDEDVSKVNSAWPHRYDGSEKFVSYSIKYHISVGLCDEAGELIAWSLRYDNGTLALVQVDENHLRKGLGSVIVKVISKKIANEEEVDVTALVKNQNEKSMNMFKKLGFKEANSHTWFVMHQKPKISMSDSLVEVPFESFSNLRDKFKVEWPKHILAFSIFEIFLKRKNQQELKVYSLNGDWNDGTFVAVLREKDVMFATLEPSQERLKRALKLLSYETVEIFFMCVRKDYRKMIDEIIMEKKLQKAFDDGTTMKYLRQEDAMKFDVEIPVNFDLRPVTEENAATINEVWPFRSEGSITFIKYIIEHNLSMGLFNETGELVAWCLLHDFGSLGALQVDEKHLRKGYAQVVTKAICKKIAKEWKLDITSNIVNNNFKSMNLFDKLGFQELDKNFWIGIKKLQ